MVMVCCLCCIYSREKEELGDPGMAGDCIGGHLPVLSLSYISSASARNTPGVWKSVRSRSVSGRSSSVFRADAVFIEFRICPKHARRLEE